MLFALNFLGLSLDINGSDISRSFKLWELTGVQNLEASSIAVCKSEFIWNLTFSYL